LVESSSPDKILTGSYVYKTLNIHTQTPAKRQKCDANAVLDTVGSICSKSTCSSSSGPRYKSPGRIGPVTLPGCASYQDENIQMLASGSGDLLSDLFCIKFVMKMQGKDVFEIGNELANYVSSHCERPEHIIGCIAVVTVDAKKLLVFCHNSPTFLIGYKKYEASKATVIWSSCRDKNTPTLHIEML